MRAVLQALNTITVAVGNTIDLIIVSSTDKILPKQVFILKINFLLIGAVSNFVRRKTYKTS